MNAAEIAFYDALAEKTSTEDVLGDDKLHEIAKVLIKTVRANIKIDWRTREDVRAGLQAEVKKVLRRYKFPPDKLQATAQLILLQAEALGEELERAALGLYSYKMSPMVRRKRNYDGYYQAV